jgi:aldehyde:ferredoxin oxidoreductase
MSYGFNGKILRVDLTSNTVSTEEPDEKFYREYFGGRGFVAAYLLKELRQGVDPLGPDNVLIFASGVVTGAPLPGSGRSGVGGKSPLTGGFGASEMGGYWGYELKRAGYDAVLIKGRASKPVYLWIHDGEAEIKDAGHLWGRRTLECQEKIAEELGEKSVRIAQIGPGGERLARYACIVGDLHHFAGRTGMGAVMGSKNLKAVAVRGHSFPELADADKIRAIAKWLGDNYMKMRGGMYEHGTAGDVEPLNMQGGLPTFNFRDGSFEGASGISGETMTETILADRLGCYACPIRCKRAVEATEPYPLNRAYGGPEYESIAALGSNCGVGDMAAVARANELCNAYGLDTISTGVTISFAMECFENGLLSKSDTEGMELRFGNADALIRTVELIGQRQGIGDLLAEGSKRASMEIGGGSESYAIHVKGQELPMHEPRLKHGIGMGYTITPTGADHNHNFHDTFYAAEGGPMAALRALGVLEPLPADDLSPAKVRMAMYRSNWSHLWSCAGMCIFLPYSFAQTVDIVNSITGWNTTVWELLKVAERVVTLARVFNVREGFGPQDDVLPERFFTPFSSGPLEGVAVDKEALEKAVHTYYGMMGWDPATGVPTEYKLHELGVGWAAESV